MFYADKRQWKTAHDFTAHLAAHDPAVAPWARGIVLHHTWSPTVASWRGMMTLNGMQRFYEKQGWDRGPHLYLCTGAPKPDDDGIWQLTPLNMQGIHAGTANRWAWGIEVVGNYDVGTWSPATFTLVRDVVLALCAWRGIAISRDTLIGHREVPSPKTCPGRFVDMHSIRRQFAFAQEPTP